MREKSKTCFNNVEVSPFRKTILFRCVRWSGEVRDIIKCKKVSKRNILTVIIRVQCMNVFVAPDIVAALKKFHGKEWISGILFFNGELYYLRSRHLVLWLLGTLTGQQRFYGTRLVTQKGGYYHPLSVMPKADCIADFVINC
jgi:hypothetical protein